MANAMPADQLLERAASILPSSGEDLIYKGVVAGVSERLFTLKRRRWQLEQKHGSIDELEIRQDRRGHSRRSYPLHEPLKMASHRS